jgi:hypothetical protein
MLYLYFSRTTKLVVAFFRQNAHKSREEIFNESKLVVPTPPNISHDVWFAFNEMVKMFFDEFGGSEKGRKSLKSADLESEVTNLVSCFIAVGLSHDKLVEAFCTKDNFERNLRCLLLEFCSSSTSLEIKELQQVGTKK